MKRLLFLVIFLCGCSANKQLRIDLDNAEQSINDLRTYQAEQATQIESLKNEIRGLTGRLDLLEHFSSSNDISGLRSDLSNLKRRVPPPAGVPSEMLDMDEVLAGSLREDVGRLFGDGLQKIREGLFENAVPVMRNALDLSYGKDWSANILYWLGVTYENLNDNRNALASYNEIINRFSKHSRAPNAMLRQSELLLKLGDKSTAKLAYKKLTTDYPKSKEAAQARDKLKNL